MFSALVFLDVTVTACDETSDHLNFSSKDLGENEHKQMQSHTIKYIDFCDICQFVHLTFWFSFSTV